MGAPRPAASPAEIEDAKRLRVRVFCGEQGVDRKAELDGLDDDAVHIVAVEGGEVVGTCRLRFDRGRCKLERMVVDADHRGDGVGGDLIAAAEEEARRRGSSEIVLHSQVRVRGFYEWAGFAALSEEVLLEEGIEHVRMRKPL